MDRSKFYNTIRGSRTSVFGRSLSKSQVTGMEGIIDAMEEVGDGRDRTLAYALATAYHETGARMEPVREGFAKSDAGAIKAVQRLAQKRGPKSAVARYSKPDGPYGKTYFGRGYVQLTWLENYKNCSADAQEDLVKNPDAMLVPKTSARILILGLLDGRWNGAGKGIEYYLPTDGPEDLKNARRTVNITDQWEKIAGYYRDFYLALDAAGGAISKNVPYNNPEEACEPAALDKQTPISKWLAACPADVRAVGKWLSNMPE